MLTKIYCFTFLGDLPQKLFDLLIEFELFVLIF